MRLSEQMLKYNPTDNLYPGDTKMREYNQNNKKRRSSIDGRVKSCPTDSGITMDHYREAVESGRLCLSLEDIREHFSSVYSDKGNNRKPCEVCGEQTIWRCGL